MALRYASVPLVLLLGALAACSEKADEPRNPAAPGPGGASTDEVGPGPLVAGIPESAHLMPTDIDANAMVANLTSGACRIEHIVTVTDEEPAETDSPVQFRVDNKQGYRLVGFMVDKDAGQVPTDVELVLSGVGTYSVPIKTGLPRGDVAEFFSNPALANAGFLEDVAFARVEPGDYALYMVDKAGGTTCSTSQSITITK